MAKVTIRYWASARAAAGTDSETYDAATLADALDAARAAHGEALARVLSVCSYIIDEAPVGTRPHGELVLADGATVEVLPPFAGG
jgi:sulfur-carrier protein